MSACTCRLRADECTGSSGIYYPLQDGGECALQDCEKQITTDNSATLVNALAEIERLTAERDAALADAKRYQFGRALYIKAHPECTPEELDTATDEMMKGEQS